VEVRDPEALLPILVCPRCRAGGLHLTDDADRITCGTCGTAYAVVDGVPVLTPDEHHPSVMPLDHASNPMDDSALDWLADVDDGGWSLHLGAGATPRPVAHCVEVEYAVFRHTDVVGDGHRLPFADDIFDKVLTLNTFEHLRDPRAAAGELHRVMKPGGHLHLLTAFMQPLHEEPNHYYNATEFGVREWFRDFDIDAVEVPWYQTPANGLAWLVTEILHHIGLEQGWDVSDKLAKTTLHEVRAIWADAERRNGPFWDACRALPEPVQRRFTPTFSMDAHKPRPPDDGG
jgi:uncharacterized protein YbaR (Trm112 family)